MLRDGMGQTAGIGPADALDLLITDALVVDCNGIYKAGNLQTIESISNPLFLTEA
ncbi:hypothetical protein GCM10022407_36740 [Hymenobacter antarcticus]|uniref:Urease alpha-subunit N-terminal domain-containing protein n=1 Tax=Hymenobacter antarcticus TaxID=486270 RepID=A0ABP7QX09_9BACT